MGSIKQLNSSTCSQSVAERLKESTLKVTKLYLIVLVRENQLADEGKREKQRERENQSLRRLLEQLILFVVKLSRHCYWFG